MSDQALPIQALHARIEALESSAQNDHELLAMRWTQLEAAWDEVTALKSQLAASRLARIAETARALYVRAVDRAKNEGRCSAELVHGEADDCYTEAEYLEAAHAAFVESQAKGKQ